MSDIQSVRKLEINKKNTKTNEQLTRSEPSGNRCCARVRCKLQHCPLPVGPGRDDEHFRGMFNGGDSSGRKQQFLPGVAQIDNVHTVGATLVNVLFHLEIDVCRAQMGVCG